MPSLRPFLSYAAADRGLVERIAVRLLVGGLTPIYDLWWLRSASGGDRVLSKQELTMGVGHADAFVYFHSRASASSAYVKHECEWALSRTCSDTPDLPMICVLLDDPAAHVPHWFRTRLDWTASGRRPVASTELLTALGWTAAESPEPGIRECRQLAASRDFARLRARLHDPAPDVRCESAILLAFLDDGLDPAAFPAVVRELGRGLHTGQAERALFALGKLRPAAAAAIEDLARFVEGNAELGTRAWAIRVLGRIGPRAETVNALIRVAAGPVGLRKAAITELGHMRGAANAAVPILVRLSRADDRHLRLIALTALGKIGDRSRMVLVAVLAALADTEPVGMSPSQLHHAAMIVMNQLAPDEDELARAVLACHGRSAAFAAWLREQLPDCDAAIRGATSPLDEVLRSAARSILSGCGWAGKSLPY